MFPRRKWRKRGWWGRWRGGEEGDDEWQISRYERSDPKRVSNGFEQQGIERRGTLSGGIRFKNSIIRRRKRRNVSLSWIEMEKFFFVVSLSFLLPYLVSLLRPCPLPCLACVHSWIGGKAAQSNGETNRRKSRAWFNDSNGDPANRRSAGSELNEGGVEYGEKKGKWKFPIRGGWERLINGTMALSRPSLPENEGRVTPGIENNRGYEIPATVSTDLWNLG